MIWYSDCIVTDQNNASLDLYTHSKLMLGKSINIYRCGENVWSGVMDSKNKHIELPPPDEVLQHYTIVLSDERLRVSYPWTVMRLQPDEPYIICDIDFTISATNAFKYLMRKITGLKTIGNSMDVLRRLSEHYRIIYLTGRIERYTKMSRMWLEKNLYPIGPILARPKDFPLKLADFKTNILKSITAISSQGIGIGDLKSDIIAYQQSGIVPIKIKHPFNDYKSTRTDIQFKDNYYLVKSWSGIEQLFREKRFFLDKE